MKEERCRFEEKIVQASRTGNWTDELLAHAAECRACEEVALVASYLCESSNVARLGAELPDAGRIWWKAQAARKAEAMERALRPIVWARRFAFGVFAAALVAAIVMWWPQLVVFFGNFAEMWTRRNATPSAGHDNFLLLATAIFLVILVPLVFGLYAAWSED
jgi:hypothetical protein